MTFLYENVESFRFEDFTIKYFFNYMKLKLNKNFKQLQLILVSFDIFQKHSFARNSCIFHQIIAICML